MFLAVCLVLLAGYPVAFSLGGTALAFALFGEMAGSFDPAFLDALPNRLYGIMTNQTLIAVPLFVFMGVMLERSKVAENLLDTMAALFGPLRGGLGISVTIVGMLLAASTGIVGATVVTMGLLSLPTMLKRGYSPALATGTICASGTLGQIIPPSIILVLLGDVLSSAYQQAQLDMGDLVARYGFSRRPVRGRPAARVCCSSVSTSSTSPASPCFNPRPPRRSPRRSAPTGAGPGDSRRQGAAAAAGADPRGARVDHGRRRHADGGGLGRCGRCDHPRRDPGAVLAGSAAPRWCACTTQVTAMVFLILIGASLFSLVFRGLRRR